MANQCRRETESVETELNLIPIMNLVLMLIPTILISAVFVQLSVINVAPPIGCVRWPNPQEKPTPQPLNLKITLQEQGISLSGSGGVLPGPDAKSPTIPKMANGQYDWPALTAKLAEIKDAFPEDERVILTGDGDVPFESLVRAMDASRETSSHRVLFPELALHGSGF